MPPVTQRDAEAILADMLGTLERFSGRRQPDLALARALTATCCRIIEERDRDRRAGLATLQAVAPFPIGAPIRALI